MAKIVVFDSGLGSLSVIKAIQKKTKADIIYFADQKNFPYGIKSVSHLKKIIYITIDNLRKQFEPDLIIIGSNTPSILFEDIFRNDTSLVGVFPPLIEAQLITKTKSIAILSTRSVVNSKKFDQHINKNLVKGIKILKINANDLIQLVESGQFIYNKNYCRKQIRLFLTQKFAQHNVDVVTLSSTHLPFLSLMLSEIFPQITFLDPAEKIAQQIVIHKNFHESKKNSLKIFSSGNTTDFQKHLKHIGIKNKVNKLIFNYEF